MIALFTDFGIKGPYLGQMEAVLADQAPAQPVVNLMADAPAFNPRASAYLLAALADGLPNGTVFICVVDPGVGGSRRAVAVKTAKHWFVGPDNGLLAVIARQASVALWFDIIWRPEKMSPSFHGRDLFAPVAARLADGDESDLRAGAPGIGSDWPSDIAEIIYIDDFGNAMTGYRAERMPPGAQVSTAGQIITAAETFSAVSVGAAFHYANANGLLELAVNQGHAAQILKLAIGDPITITTLPGVLEASGNQRERTN